MGAAQPSTRHSASFETFLLVLLGQSGSGKSATGNTILGQRAFQSKPSSKATTTQCEEGSMDFDGIHVKVIDTPDFFDKSLWQRKTHIRECRQMCKGQVCVYLLVIQIGRFTEGERDILERLEGELGKIRDRTIILFTYGGDLQSDQSIDDYVRDTDPHLQQLIKKCGNRYHVFNNKDKDEGRRQVKELMGKIAKLAVNTISTLQEAEKKKNIWMYIAVFLSISTVSSILFFSLKLLHIF